MGPRDWRVLREDDRGERRVIAEALSEGEARLLAAAHSMRGNARRCWAERLTRAPTNRP
jgi:hypothetical protein